MRTLCQVFSAGSRQAVLPARCWPLGRRDAVSGESLGNERELPRRSPHLDGEACGEGWPGHWRGLRTETRCQLGNLALRIRDGPGVRLQVFLHGLGSCPSRKLAPVALLDIARSSCILLQRFSLNLSQFVEGRKWWPWAREGLEEARVCAGHKPCIGEEIRRIPARLYALQGVRH